MIVPVVQSIPDYLDSIDIDSTINLLAKQAGEIALKTGLETARSRVHQISVDMLRASKLGFFFFTPNKMCFFCFISPQLNIGSGGGMNPAFGGYNPQMAQQHATNTPPPASLQLLPLYSMSLQKSLALRGGNNVRLDERSFYFHLLANMTIDESRIFIYPRMFSIHDMPPDAGIASDSGELVSVSVSVRVCVRIYV